MSQTSRRLITLLPLLMLVLFLGTRHADSPAEQFARIATLIGFCMIVAGYGVAIWRERTRRRG